MGIACCAAYRRALSAGALVPSGSKLREMLHASLMNTDIAPMLSGACVAPGPDGVGIGETRSRLVFSPTDLTMNRPEALCR